MMKTNLIIAAVILSVSCSTNNPESIRKSIIGKKEQIASINQSIKKLEEKLYEDSSGMNPQFLIPVTIKKVKYETFSHFIEVQGNIEAVEDAYISPEMGGQIKKIYVKEGLRVKKGQLLVSLNTEVTESSIQEVKTSLELTKKLYDKQKALWEQNIGTEMQYLEAKNAYEQTEARLKTLKAQLDMSNIRAPFNGIIDKIYQKEGELGIPGMRILQLVNLSRLKITAEVSEIYLPSINEGKMIEVSIPTYPGMNLNVPVYRTGNVINPANRTFEIEVQLNNRSEKLKPNMFAVLKINDLTIDSAIIVPSNIIKKDILKSGEGSFREFLFIAEEKDNKVIAQKVYVQSGKTYNNESVIRDGLKPGQKVIVEGYNTVSTGTELKVLNREELSFRDERF
jgi:membrane fusion protein (multidrug efflux system)